MAGKGMSNGARHSRQVSPRAKVLLVGLGYAGVKVVRTAARQFEHPDYAFLAVDQSPELQAQCELPVLVTAAGWEQQLPELLDQRKEARKAKDFAKADALRDQIAALGYQVMETRQGTKVTKIEA